MAIRNDATYTIIDSDGDEKANVSLDDDGDLQLNVYNSYIAPDQGAELAEAILLALGYTVEYS